MVKMLHAVDTHSHIYLSDFRDDLNEIITSAITENVTKIFLPAIDSKTHADLVAIGKQFPDILFPMMGLHPCSVDENYKQELSIIEEYLFHSAEKFFAIGEIGLDYYWSTDFKEQQQIAFIQQLQWATELKLPVAIHSRNSLDECIDEVEKFSDKNLTGVFHCFSGSLPQAQRIIDLGFYLGIGGVVSFKNSNLKEIVRQIGLKNIVLETDAPYLAPSPFRGKRNEPKYIINIATAIAEILQLSVETVVDTTTLNANKLFAVE